MNRRSFLRGSAAAVGGAGATLAGVRVASRTVSADATTTLDVADDRTMLDGDGAVAAVWLVLDVEWAYDLPNGRTPEAVVVDLAAGVDGDLDVVATAESPELFAESSGSESFDVDLLDAGVLDADALAPDDGERATEVTIEARMRVENGGGDVLAESSTTDVATVTLERETVDVAEYGEVAGSGSLVIETA